MPTKPKPSAPAKQEPNTDSAYDALLKVIAEIEARIDVDNEIGVVTLGHNEGFNLVSIEESDAGFLIFYDYDHNDKPTVLVQDDTQLNLQFVVRPKRTGAAKRLGRA